MAYKGKSTWAATMVRKSRVPPHGPLYADLEAYTRAEVEEKIKALESSGWVVQDAVMEYPA